MSKDFTNINNPALSFIGTAAPGNDTKKAAEKTAEPKAVKQPRKKGNNAVKKETKSKRLNLLLYPSIFDELTKLALMKQTSVTDLLNDIARAYINKGSSQELINKYNEMFDNKE